MKINNFQMPESIVKEDSTYTDTFGRFIVQPLERGYGVTMGNSLRRVLISSLQGSAIIAIKVNDAPHEFTTLKGVVAHHSKPIPNAVVYIKYNTSEFPSDDGTTYNTSVTADEQGNYSIDFYKGTYYIYAVGLDMDIPYPYKVSGGLSVSIRNKENLTKDIAVTEE